MGKKSAEKCYKELWANTSFTLDNFIGGLSITMVGRTTTKLLIKSGYSTIEQLYNLTEAKLSLIDGIGPVKAKSLVEGLKENKELITNLLTKVSIKQQVQGKLTNKSVCFTGTMNTKRDVLQKMASDAGAEVKNSVSKGLTYLVISDPSSTSTKAQTARKALVKLISEEEFLAMI
jgi:DNA ligase (NAD+)